MRPAKSVANGKLGLASSVAIGYNKSIARAWSPVMERQMTQLLTHVSYELGARQIFATKTGPILVRNTKTLEGVLAWARDERTGEYVRVYEVGPTEWVQDEPQAWSSGNFMSVEDAQHSASKAYRWINKGRGR
jgi:hypothetical protein